VSDWGRALYGDPCRECGFEWSTSLEDATTLVRNLPTSYEEVVAGAAGSERHRELAWSVTAYVCHVSDNLRIWAERLAGVAGGGQREVVAYDENALAAARRYEDVSLQAALWSLERAVVDWLIAVEQANDVEVVLLHSERGRQTVIDVVRSTAHDAFHHLWDVRRTLQVQE
jgi:hypothetical protein